MKQVTKVGVQGSLINQLMGNNNSVPIVGEYCTIMHYTDRTVAKVVEVSEDGKRCVIQDCRAYPNPATKNDMGHQNWLFEDTAYTSNLVYSEKYQCWYKETKTIEFCKKFEESPQFEERNLPHMAAILWDEDVHLKLVEGYTREKKGKSKISIIFGSANYYYDWEF